MKHGQLTWETTWSYLFVFLVYFCAGWVGIRYAAIADGSLSLLWLPSGVGLSACILFGKRIWPAIWLGSFASNTPFLIDAAANYPYLKAALYGAGAATINTTVQSLFAYKLYQRFVEPVGFASRLGVLEFVFRVAMIPSIFNVLFLIPLYYSGGYAAIAAPTLLEDLASIWYPASLGDLHGYFIVTPLALSWWTLRGNLDIQKLDWQAATFFSASFILLMAAALFITWQAAFLLLPLGVLVALRYGIAGSSLFIFSLSLTLTLATAQQIGPLYLGTPLESFSTLLLFVFCLGIPVLLLAAESGELRDYQHKLEGRVADRTQELALKISELEQQENALAAAKIEAEDANNSKSRFLAAASHDLRQPLHAMSLFVGSLAESVTTAEQHTLIDNIENSQESLQVLLNALMDVSRIDSGDINVDQQYLPLAPLLKKLFVAYRDIAKEKGLKLRLADTSLSTFSDPQLLERILSNLMENAIKYTAQGSILIGCRRLGEECRIDILDSGEGIDDDQRSRVFSEFYQLNNPERDRNKGHGLGLAIVKNLAELLKHPLEVSSVPGKGSRFSITVPRILACPKELAQAHNSLKLHPGDVPTVLLLDNEPEILAAMEIVMTGWGYHILTADGPQHALECIDEAMLRPDIIIADYHLAANLTGAEATSQIQRSFNFECPTILMTGETSKELQQTATKLGYPLLHKPVKPEALRKLILEIL